MHPTREQQQTILVVAADLDQRRLLGAVLAQGRPGLVLAAADADTALTVARTIRLNLVLLDRGVPTSGSLPLVAQFQADPTLAAIPVLLFTPFQAAAEGAARLAGDGGRPVVQPQSLMAFDSVIAEILADAALERAGITAGGADDA
jgi:CheY-like chemotaxis protein